MKLDAYLLKNSLTQEQFADEVGVAQASVNHWVNAIRMPRQEHLRRISEITRGEVTANDFYGISGDRPCS